LTKPSGMATHVPEDWSPTSDVLVFSIQQGAESDLWTWNESRRTIEKMGGQRTGAAANAMFSPDGEWLAYTQRMSGARGNVRTYVQSVRSPDVRYQVGRDEEVAHHPLWSRDGRRLYYFPSGFPVVSVDIRFTPSFGFGEPVPLPGQGLPVNVSPVSSLNHDIAPDGRFVVVGSADAPSEEGGSSDSIVIVQNWFEELKRQVPR
jgi:Tol biopolymer transport system component